MFKFSWNRIMVSGLVVASLTGFGIYCYAETNNSDISWLKIENEQTKLDNAFDNLRIFRFELNQTLNEICDDDISLAQAIDQVEDASRKNYPDFVRHLMTLKKCSSVREAIGDNIIGFFASEIEAGKNDERLQTVVNRLRAEQAQMFHEGHAPVSATSH